MTQYSKQKLIKQALEYIGLNPNYVDIETAQYDSALIQLNAMMAGWKVLGVDIGYPVVQDNSDVITNDSLIDAGYYEVVCRNLAIRLAPNFGKICQPEMMKIAKEGFNGLMKAAALPTTMSLGDKIPCGQGNHPWVTIPTPFSN